MRGNPAPVMGQATALRLKNMPSNQPDGISQLFPNLAYFCIDITTECRSITIYEADLFSIKITGKRVSLECRQNIKR